MSTGPQPPGEAFGPSPIYCASCNHKGNVPACRGCGGPTGGNGWGPCSYCLATIGAQETQELPPSPMAMTSTIHGDIEATEPRYLPPLEAMAHAATDIDTESVDDVADELHYMRVAIEQLGQQIKELSSRIGQLTLELHGRETR